MGATPVDGRWRGTPLPRGRHTLSPSLVKASQRERLLRAMLECVGEHGYEETTVPEVVAAARVAKNSFYEFFDNKLECFLALCDEEAQDLFRVATSGPPAPTWRIRAGQRTAEYLRWWQDRPAFSRAYFVELPFAGPKAIEQRERQSEPYRQMYRAVARRARIEEPRLPPLPERGPDILVAGIVDAVAREVRAGRGGQVVELADALTSVTIAVLSGAPAIDS
jgi:AcrR family transcriptional regulator